MSTLFACCGGRSKTHHDKPLSSGPIHIQGCCRASNAPEVLSGAAMEQLPWPF